MTTMTEDSSLSNLIPCDPNFLFEKFNKDEVEGVHSKLNHEIEKKKEELRTMVGERYRVLINAADKIESMERLSLQIIDDIDDLSSSCASLKDKMTSRHFNSMSRLPDNSDYSSRNNFVAQIKIIMDLSKEIWSHIDNEQFLKATLLYRLLCFIKTSLDVNHQHSISLEFPVVRQLWHYISHFQRSIVRKAEDKLQSSSLTVETASECLCSLVLLENLNFEGLQSKFLKLRSEALENCFTATEDVPIIKSRIGNSLCLLSNTLHVFYFCFVGNNLSATGFVTEHLSEITNPQSTPLLSQLEYNEGAELQKFLSPVIKNFRPSVPLGLNLDDSKPSKTLSSISNWLKWVTEIIRVQGKKFLGLVKTPRSLQTLQEHNISFPADWLLVVEKLHLPIDLDPWHHFYHPLFMSRAEELISHCWKQILAAIIQRTSATLDEMNDSDKKEPELDLKWHVWAESPSDLELTSFSKKKESSGLLLKSKGFSPRIASLCNSLQSLLLDLLEDLSNLIPDTTLVQNAKAEELKDHQQTCCHSFIESLIKWIESKVDSITSLSQVVTLARFSSAIPILCPALQKCLSTGSWLEANSSFQNASKIAWGAWLKLVKPKLETDLLETLKIPVDSSGFLMSHLTWETVKIEEANEQNVLITSELNVPCFPSVQVQSVISNISHLISTLSFHPLIRDELINYTVEKMLLIYNHIVADPNALQFHYLQCLFDVEFLLTAVVPPESKHISNLCNETISKIQEKIDPFDLDVVSPNLHNNVKKSLYSIHCLYGVISPEKNFSMKLQDNQNLKSEEPVVIPTKNNGPWFPLLPLTSQSNSRTVSSAPKSTSMKKNSVLGEPSNKSNASSTSFFGVTDWFR